MWNSIMKKSFGVPDTEMQTIEIQKIESYQVHMLLTDGDSTTRIRPAMTGKMMMHIQVPKKPRFKLINGGRDK